MSIIGYLKFQNSKKKLSKTWNMRPELWGSEEKAAFTLLMGTQILDKAAADFFSYTYIQLDMILTSTVWSACFHKDFKNITDDTNFRNNLFNLIVDGLHALYKVDQTIIQSTLENRYLFLSQYLQPGCDGKVFLEEVGYILANDLIDKKLAPFKSDSPLPVHNISTQMQIEVTVRTYYECLIPMLVELFNNPNKYTV